MVLPKRLMWKQGVLLYDIQLKKELMRLNQLGLKFSFYYLSSFSIPISNDARYIYVSSAYHFVFWKLLHLSYDTILIILVRLRFDFLMSHSFDSKIAEIYNERFLEFGPMPEASMWYSKKRQFARFDIILDQIKSLSQKNKMSVSDIGCGYGAFLEFLSERKYSLELHYYGYDVSDVVVKFCQKKYSNRASFHTGSIPIMDSDFIIMSGTFNFFPSRDYNAWRRYFYNFLNLFWSKLKCAMIFNLQIAEQEKITEGGIVYSSQKEIESFCKSSFGNVSLITNPTVPKDMTFVVSKHSRF